jgi:hypothetical protein
MMKTLLLLAGLLLLAVPSSASTVYFAQSSAGGNTGADCADAIALSAVTWTAGNTYHACNTITSTVTINASGSSGSLITLIFETGAAVQQPACPGNGCLDMSSQSWILIDGSPTSTPCGYVAQQDVSCNGLVQATVSGTGSGSGGPCIRARATSNIEIRNLAVANCYVHTGSGNDTNNGGPAYGVQVDGSNIHVHNIIVHDAYDGVGGGATWTASEIDHSQFYNINWGVNAFGSSVGCGVNNIKIHDNDIHDFASWDTSSDTFHHDGIIVAGNDNLADGVCNVAAYGNYLHGSVGSCCTTAYIYFNDENHGSVFNNTVVANSGEFTGVGWIYFLTFGTLDANDLIANNTVIGGHQGANNGPCIDVSGDASMTMQNNVMSACDAGIWVGTTHATTFTALTNNIYQASSLTNYWHNGATDYSTLANWQAGISGDTSAQATTGGLNLAVNFAPNASSILIGAGANLTSLCSGNLASLCFDALGNARPSSGAWSSGALNQAPSTTIPTPHRSVIEGYLRLLCPYCFKTAALTFGR